MLGNPHYLRSLGGLHFAPHTAGAAQDRSESPFGSLKARRTRLRRVIIIVSIERAMPPIGAARCMLAVMTAAGQNRLFGASGICRLAGPPANYSLHCPQLPLRLSPLHGLPSRAAGRRDVLAGVGGVLVPRSRGLLEKQLPQHVGGPGFPLTGGPPVAGGQPGECLGGAENRQQARLPGRHPGRGVARCGS